MDDEVENLIALGPQRLASMVRGLEVRLTSAEHHVEKANTEADRLRERCEALEKALDRRRRWQRKKL